MGSVLTVLCVLPIGFIIGFMWFCRLWPRCFFGRQHQVGGAFGLAVFGRQQWFAPTNQCCAAFIQPAVVSVSHRFPEPESWNQSAWHQRILGRKRGGRKGVILGTGVCEKKYRDLQSPRWEPPAPRIQCWGTPFTTNICQCRAGTFFRSAQMHPWNYTSTVDVGGRGKLHLNHMFELVFIFANTGP